VVPRSAPGIVARTPAPAPRTDDRIHDDDHRSDDHRPDDHRIDDHHPDDRRPDAVDLERELAQGLAIAARADGLTVIALPAPLVGTPAIVEAWPEAPIAAWAQRDLAIAGVGIAHELRGAGDGRWLDVVARACAVRIAGAVVGGVPCGVGTLGPARPR